MLLPNKKRKILYIAGIVVILTISSFSYLSYLASEKLPKLFGEQVAIENLDISIWGNNVRFFHPSFSIDSSQNHNRVMIQSQARQIRIEGFSILDLLLSNELGVNKLVIDSGFVHLVLPEDTVRTNSREQFHLFIRGLFTRIRVNQLELKNVNVQVTQASDMDTLLRVKGFYLTASEVVLDTVTVDNIFPLGSKKSIVRMDSFAVRTGNEYVCTGTDLLIEDTTLTVESLKLKSIYSKSEFASLHSHEKSRLDLEVTKVTSQKLLWDFDNNQFKLHSTKTILDQADLLIYKDKRSPGQPREVKPLLAQLIREIPITVTLDTVELQRTYIEYEQFPVTFPRAGKVFFANTFVSAVNMTNDTVRLIRHPQMTFQVKSDFMGKGVLTTNISLDLVSPTQEFDVHGTLGKLPITYVNQVMTPLLGVTSEGQVHGLDFQLSGDNYAAEGTVRFEYSNLKITIHDETKDKEMIKSIFGNLILRNNNQKNDSLNYKEGEIYFIRYQNKDFFNYLWNSLRVGLMDIVIPFYSNPDRSNPPSGPKLK